MWRLPCLAGLLLLVGCARFQPVPHGEFEVSYDRWVERDELVRGRTMHVRSPAPEAVADVVPRSQGGRDKVLLRKPTLPGRGIPIAIAVGRVAEFEASRTVRDVTLAGDAVRVWFTPGARLFVRGMHRGQSRLRLILASGERREIDVAVE
jgi:hypothetical protein